ncbi:MAG: putative inorganic carbon transporter subunit DabA, partial [Byssovorax sp.]
MSPRSSHSPSELNLSRRARVAEAVEHGAHLLPAQGPIATFIHHNTLHAFQHHSFHEAIREASVRLGMEGYLTESEFRSAYAAGRIDDEDLRGAFARVDLPARAAVQGAVASFVSPFALRRAMLLATPGPLTEESFRWRLHEERLTARFGVTVTAATRAALLRDTTAWVRGRLDAQDTAALAPLLGALAEAEDSRPRKESSPAPRALSALRRRLEKDGETIAARALWAACVALQKELGGAAPAEARGRPPASAASEQLVHPTLIPLCAAYLDHGVAHRTMGDRGKGFYVAWRTLWTDGVQAEPGWLTGLRAHLLDAEAKGHDATDAIVALLEEAGAPESRWTARIEAALLELPGWAGMFHRLEHVPHAGSPRTSTLDFLAVRMTLDAFAARARGAFPATRRDTPRP